MPLDWFQLALLAAVGFSAQTLLYKMILEKKISPLVLVTLVFLITTLVLLAYSFFVGEFTLPAKSDVITLLILASVITAASNVVSFRAMGASKNPGYPAAVWSSGIVLTTIASLFIFGLPIDFMKIIGIALVFAGIVLLSV